MLPHVQSHVPLQLQQGRLLQKQVNKLSTGNVLRMAGRLLKVTSAQHTLGHGRQLGIVHVRPMRACMQPHAQHRSQTLTSPLAQLELQDMQTAAKSFERMRPDVTVEVVRLEPRPYTFLYQQGAMHEIPQTLSLARARAVPQRC